MRNAKAIGALLIILLLAGSMACVSRSGNNENSSSNPVNNPSGMKEKVMSFCSNGDFVDVTFSQSAMVYRLAVESDNFPAIMQTLATAYRDGRDVTYTQKGDALVAVEIVK